MHEEGQEHSNSRCENKKGGPTRGVVCAQSLQCTERSATMVGMGSRYKNSRAKPSLRLTELC